MARTLAAAALITLAINQVFADVNHGANRAICFDTSEVSRKFNMYLMNAIPGHNHGRVCCLEDTYKRIQQLDKSEMEFELRHNQTNDNQTSASNEGRTNCYPSTNSNSKKHHVTDNQQIKLNHANSRIHKRAAPVISRVPGPIVPDASARSVTSTARPSADHESVHDSLPPLLVEVQVEETRPSISQRIPWTSILIAVLILLATLVYFYFNNSSDKYHELLVLFCTILISGFGNLGAGAVLNVVQRWDVFVRVSELLVLEPTLLGLKGNIEMCMAARMSTQANLGNLDTWKKTFKMVWGNLALDLTQATVVSSFAAIGVVIFTFFQSSGGSFVYSLVVVLSTTLVTACTASIFLGTLLVTVIITSYKLKVNPDNIGAPVAASFGDLITLTLLANYGHLIYSSTPLPGTGSFPTLGFILICALLAIGPLWFWLAFKNEYTRPNIGTGWLPIFIAVILSTCSGFILDYAAFEFRTFALFQPVINGVGGNVVAIHSSRMSTALHKSASLGEMPSDVKMYRSPMQAFFDKTEINIEMARNLVLMALPAHIIYLFVTVSAQPNTTLTVPFFLLYIGASILQVLILLYIAYHLVNLVWKQGIDPDNAVIPILTATGDFLGSLFLFISFLILNYIGDANTAT